VNELQYATLVDSTQKVFRVLVVIGQRNGAKVAPSAPNRSRGELIDAHIDNGAYLESRAMHRAWLSREKQTRQNLMN
jgi:hypothetical protein